MPKDPRCPHITHEDVASIPPTLKTRPARCVLAYGHDSDHLTPRQLDRARTDAATADHRCPQTKPRAPVFVEALIGADRCVVFTGHPGHHIFASEINPDRPLAGLEPTDTVLDDPTVPPPAGPGDLLERLLRAAGEWPDVDDEATGLVSVTSVQVEQYAARGVIVVDGREYRITVRAAGDFNPGGVVDDPLGRGVHGMEPDIPLRPPPAGPAVHVTPGHPTTLDGVHDAPRNWVFDPPIEISDGDRYTLHTDGDACVVAVKRNMAPWDEPMEILTGRLEWLDAVGPTGPIPHPDLGDFA